MIADLWDCADCPGDLGLCRVVPAEGDVDSCCAALVGLVSRMDSVVEDFCLVESAPLEECLAAAPLLMVSGFCLASEVVRAPCFMVGIGVNGEDFPFAVSCVGDAVKFRELLGDVVFGRAITRCDKRREDV